MFSDDVTNKPAKGIHKRIRNCKRGLSPFLKPRNKQRDNKQHT